MNYDSYVIGDGHTDERLKLKLWEENGLKDSVTGARFANAPQCCQHTSCDKCEICYKIVLSWHDAWMSFTSSDNSRGNAYLILLYNNYQKNPSWSYPSKCCRSVSKSRPHETYQGMFWHVYTDHGMNGARRLHGEVWDCQTWYTQMQELQKFCVSKASIITMALWKVWMWPIKHVTGRILSKIQSPHSTSSDEALKCKCNECNVEISMQIQVQNL